jgi:hypothetical protein
MSDDPKNAEREKYRIAQDVFSTLLEDQISRSDSLNSTAGVLAGLGGVVTTLAAVVPNLTQRNVGLAGIALAALSVVLAVYGLLTRRPGREPVELDLLLDRILGTGDVTLTEDVLLRADVEAAKRNDLRLKVKSRWITGAASTLAAGVVVIVIAIVEVSAS